MKLKGRKERTANSAVIPPQCGPAYPTPSPERENINHLRWIWSITTPPHFFFSGAHISISHLIRCNQKHRSCAFLSPQPTNPLFRRRSLAYTYYSRVHLSGKKRKEAIMSIIESICCFGVLIHSRCSIMTWKGGTR